MENTVSSNTVTSSATNVNVTSASATNTNVTTLTSSNTLTSSATETTTVTETDPTDPAAVSATIYLGAGQDGGERIEGNQYGESGQGGGLMGNPDYYPGYSVDVPLVLDADAESNIEQSSDQYEALTDILIEVDAIVEEATTIDVDTTVEVIEQSTATATREVE